MLEELQRIHDVACCKNGGKIIFSTDDFFGVAENLIKLEEPIWKEGLYTTFGKWMDGWETRRRRKPGHDFCIVELGALAVIRGINLNTAFFTGNYAPYVSIQASIHLDEALSGVPRIPETGTEASEEAVDKFNSVTSGWTTILENMPIKPGHEGTKDNVFSININSCWKYLRLNLYPDGGVARLRVYGQVVPPRKMDNLLDLVAIANGGECVKFSNAHFGHPKNLLSPLRATTMADGWETARRIDRTRILKELPGGFLNYNGTEWCIIKLGVPGIIKTVVVQTFHFIGNYPDRVQIEGATEDILNEDSWRVIQQFAKVCLHSIDIARESRVGQ